MKVERERFVEAPADHAFALLRDFSKLPLYNPAVSAVRAREGPCEPGDTFTLRLGRATRVAGTVLEVGERHVALRMRSIVDALEVRHVRPEASGCTIGWTVTFSAPWWLGGRLGEYLYFRRLTETNLETELELASRILEGAA